MVASSATTEPAEEQRGTMMHSPERVESRDFLRKTGIESHVGRALRNQQVIGSSPIAGSIRNSHTRHEIPPTARCACGEKSAASCVKTYGSRVATVQHFAKRYIAKHKAPPKGQILAMKTTLIGLLAAIALIVMPRAAVAQDFNQWTPAAASWGSGWCQRCYVIGQVDVPNTSSGWTGAIIGWGSNCGTGEAVDRVEVHYSSATETHRVTTFTPYLYLTRDDVSLYFARGGATLVLGGLSSFGDKILTCTAVRSNTGWAIVPHGIPPGTWKLTVVMWSKSIASSTSAFVTVQ